MPSSIPIVIRVMPRDRLIFTLYKKQLNVKTELMYIDIMFWCYRESVITADYHSGKTLKLKTFSLNF